MDADDQTEVTLFVHFDFMFFPMRVHSGDGAVDWDGHEWQGIGRVLWKGAKSRGTVLSGRKSVRGRMSASIRMSEEVREILSEEYHRDCEMQWMLCKMERNGHVGTRVHINRGGIISHSVEDDIVTFTAECNLFDSPQVKDERHKRKVLATRERFRAHVKETILDGALGWCVSAIEAVAGELVGLFTDGVEHAAQGRNRRIGRQWWLAKERTYWFRTQPAIPEIKLRRHGYKVKADTLEEAKSKLYGMVAKRIWGVPPSDVGMIVYWNDGPMQWVDLDKIRERFDAKRYDEITSSRRWPP